jgi:ABC-type antimicrobial peptide transport system permease subunit
VLRLNLQSISPVGDFNYGVVGRLKLMTIDSAQAELDVLQAEIAREAADETKQNVGLRALVRPLSESIVGGARRGLVLLLAAIGAVLMVACSNLANLSLTRTLARQRDAAIPTALGASGRRLVGRVVLEQLILAAIGGALGIAVAAIALRLFVTTAPIDLPRVTEVALDFRCWPSPHSSRRLLDCSWPSSAWRMAGRDVGHPSRRWRHLTGGAGLRTIPLLTKSLSP